jgi:hypothetical protein
MFTPFAFVKSAASVGPYVPTNTEVINWATATGITTTSLIQAVDDFVSGCKTDNIWTKFDILYPLVTDSTNSSTIKDQFKINLVNTSSFTLTYTGSSTVGYGGYTNGGSGAMVGTGFVPSTNLSSSNSAHMGIYTTSTNPGTDVIDAGGGSGVNYSLIICGRTTNDNTNQCEVAMVSGQFCGTTGNSIFTGLFVGTYTNPTAESYNTRLWRRGSIVQNDTGTGTIADRQLSFGAWYYDNTINNATSKQYQFFSFGDHMTSTDVSNFNTRVNTLQSAVDTIYGTSRAV